MLDFGQFGVDLDNDVLDIDFRRQYQILCARLTFPERRAKEFSASPTWRSPVLFPATAPAHRLLRVLGGLVQTKAGKWITHPPASCPGTPSARTKC